MYRLWRLLSLHQHAFDGANKRAPAAITSRRYRRMWAKNMKLADQRMPSDLSINALPAAIASRRYRRMWAKNMKLADQRMPLILSINTFLLPLHLAGIAACGPRT
jgi:hypothetical protein